MTVPQTLIREFDAIADYIKAVREILQGGHMPDMASLDRRVTALCEAIGKAEADVQQECLPRLNVLLQNLDICEGDIRATRTPPAKEGAQDG